MPKPQISHLSYRIDPEIVEAVYAQPHKSADYWDNNDRTYAHLVRSWLKRAHQIRLSEGDTAAQYYLEACACLAEAMRRQDELDAQLA